MVGMYYFKTQVAQIPDPDYPVREPAQQETRSRSKRCGIDSGGKKLLTLTEAPILETLSESIPSVCPGISAEHIQRTDGNRLHPSGRIPPETFQRAFGNMFTEFGLHGIRQGDESIMGMERCSECLLHTTAKKNDFRNRR